MYSQRIGIGLTCLLVGAFICGKYRQRAQDAGGYAAPAMALRKQGIPLHVALAILLGVRERPAPRP